MLEPQSLHSQLTGDSYRPSRLSYTVAVTKQHRPLDRSKGSTCPGFTCQIRSTNPSLTHHHNHHHMSVAWAGSPTCQRFNCRSNALINTSPSHIWQCHLEHKSKIFGGKNQCTFIRWLSLISDWTCINNHIHQLTLTFLIHSPTLLRRHYVFTVYNSPTQDIPTCHPHSSTTRVNQCQIHQRNHSLTWYHHQKSCQHSIILPTTTKPHIQHPPPSHPKQVQIIYFLL